MIIIGLSGQSGAGKTTALEVLKGYGAVVCDSDLVSRKVMAKDTPCTKELIEVFGGEIAYDGEINRRKLGEIVFFDKKKLEKLTEITHRYIKESIFSSIDSARASDERFFVIDAPLLFESGLDAFCDVTLAVVAERETRIKRIMCRDGITRELAEKRLDAQLSEEELKKLADEVIENNSNAEDFIEKVKNFAERKGMVK
ncbi:MAG: dephospho-CoA kinase [Clostridia bacterium]|nr:dephospho-CoA kinase [Clostridia bacterium]